MSAVRALVRTTGELLVTGGVLILLFLVWQLFWTDVVANSSQEQTTDALLEQWQQPSAGGATTGAPVPEAGTPAADPGPAPAPAAALADLPAQAVAVLRVPAFGDDYVKPILQGTTTAVLREGIGQYAGTAGPGEVGNFAIAGHRTTYGAPFNPIAELVDGDPVVVETADSYFVYRVVDADIVGPEDVEVIAPVPGEPGAVPSEAYLTMTSCHPMYSARERYVVHAVLETVSARAEGAPEVLA